MKRLLIIISALLISSCSLSPEKSSRFLASDDANSCILVPHSSRFLGKGHKIREENESIVTASSAEECYQKAISSIKQDFKLENFKLYYGFQELEQALLAQQQVEWKYREERGVVSMKSSKDFADGFQVNRPMCFYAPTYYNSESRQYTDETRVKFAYVEKWEECYKIALEAVNKLKARGQKRFIYSKFPAPSYKSYPSNTSMKWGFRKVGILNDRNGYVDKSSSFSAPRPGDLRVK